MPNRRVRVVRSVKLNGKWKFMNPQAAQRQRIPNDQGRWYITWRDGNKKEWERCDSWTHALAQKLKKEGELHALSAGVELAAPKLGRITFDDAVEQFNEDLRLRNRRKETIEAYRLVFENFKVTFEKQYLDQIERRDMLRFADAMRKAKLAERTVANRWLAFMTFLKHFGIKGVTNRYDTPRFVEGEAEAYSQEEMQKFLTACNDEQRLLYSFYLKTGFRMQEVMYLQYSDVDFKHRTVSVKAKPQFDFRPKSWETRTVPLEEALALALERRLRGRKASILVFPTRTGRPNNKHLQAMKRIAKRAKLDETQWWLHKFRATFATWHLQAGVDIRTVQSWLGHKSVETTLRYLQPARGSAINAKFNATFAGMNIPAVGARGNATT